MTQAIYAYIPVVHSGVLTFLNKYPDVPIWILDNIKGAEENVYLERDIRALSAQQIKQELGAHGFKNMQVIDQHMLAKMSQGVDELIVPEDEIVAFFTEKYIPEIQTIKVSTFLRWTKQISTTEFVVPPDRIITSDTFSREVMAKLQIEAQKSSDWWRQIGATIFKDGTFIATAHNHHSPTPHSLHINGDPRSNLDAGQGPGVYTSIHAEASAIAQSARQGVSTAGCDLFVTTFPCPACARSLVEAGIKRVFYSKGYSLLDAEVILKDAGIEIILVQDTGFIPHES